MKSMTGYGSCKSGGIFVEIKSVNNRFFEFSFHAPNGYLFLENKIRALLMEKVSRGKIDVFLRFDSTKEDCAKVAVNHALASEYVTELSKISESFGVQNSPTALQILSLEGVFTLKKPLVDENAVFQKVLPCFEAALSAFIAMRTFEGDKLKSDISEKIACILNILSKIKKNSLRVSENYKNRLLKSINELLGQVNTEFFEQRILTEVAIFADKTSIDEEIVRLESHIDQACGLLDSDESVGKKMDFIVQEMNREINTVGSKCCDIEVSRMVIDVKTTIEKIREQIQNIE